VRKEIVKLIEAASVETAAADDWWKELPTKEKKAYLTAHPGSKYAKGAKPLTAKGASALASEHYKLSNKHGSIAEKSFYKGDKASYNVNDKLAILHGRIHNHYAKAKEALKLGQPATANNHLANAEKAQHRLWKHKLATGLIKPKS